MITLGHPVYSADGPPTFWSWTAPASDTYRLEYRVSNAGDGEFDSRALFDAEPFAAVPEPSSLLALVSGIGGLGGLLWRRRK